MRGLHKVPCPLADIDGSCARRLGICKRRSISIAWLTGVLLACGSGCRTWEAPALLGGGSGGANGSPGGSGGSGNGSGGGGGSGSATDPPSLAGLQFFPPDNPWNQDISSLPVHANSTAYLTSIGLDTGLHADFGTVWNGAPNGIPYTVVRGNQARVAVTFDYDDESDPGPYPIPPDAPIEGGPNATGDRHVLVVDLDNKKLYELFSAYPSGGGWSAGSGAIFDLNSNALRPAGWTSADAAGLPILPGLVRYDEAVEQGEIRHALRFTVSRSQRAYIPPATHFASSRTDANLPPMGLRVRLKASFNVAPYPPAVQVILRAMKTYGMFVADNGSNWYVSGAPDSRWSDDDLHTLGSVRGRDFEVVYTGELVK